MKLLRKGRESPSTDRSMSFCIQSIAVKAKFCAFMFPWIATVDNFRVEIKIATLTGVSLSTSWGRGGPIHLVRAIRLFPNHRIASSAAARPDSRRRVAQHTDNSCGLLVLVFSSVLRLSCFQDWRRKDELSIAYFHAVAHGLCC